MASWHRFHLTFEPNLSSEDWSSFTGEMKDFDGDFPADRLSVVGVKEEKNSSYSGVTSEDEHWTLWRSPLSGSFEAMMESLKSVGAVGHGWLDQCTQDHGWHPPSPTERFTFGGGFPEIDIAAEREKKRLELVGKTYTAQCDLVALARDEEVDATVLAEVAAVLRSADADLAAYLAVHTNQTNRGRT